jgi:hypothetical protein
MKTLFTLFILILTAVLLLTVGTAVFIINSIRTIYRKESLLKYFLSIIESQDQLGGTIIFKSLDFTISSKLYEGHERGNIYASFFMNIVDILAMFIAKGLYSIKYISLTEYQRQKTHCKSAYEKEMNEFKEKQPKQVANFLKTILEKWFEDEDNHYLLKFDDDGSLTSWMCVDWEIVNENNQIVANGKAGTGINYDPSLNLFTQV